MSINEQQSVVRGRLAFLVTLGWSLVGAAVADDFGVLCADRAAVERVYYNHRTGTKPPFEQVLPREKLERLVRDDLRKLTILQKNYGVEVSTAMLIAEVRRIDASTRAPETLVEIKAALGDDANRFARTVAKPIVVERLLREKFENDEALHAPQRRACELVRDSLLAAKTNGATLDQLLSHLQQAVSNAVTETTWQLGVRPAETNAPPADELEIKKRFGPGAQLLSSPSLVARDRQSYFSDLPPALQNVLSVQLRQAGDISAVIETPSDFRLCVCTAKASGTLAVATLSLPKSSYEQWLNEQNTTP